MLVGFLETSDQAFQNFASCALMPFSPGSAKESSGAITAGRPRVAGGGGSFLPGHLGSTAYTEQLATVPVVNMLLGSVVGIGAAKAVLGHFSVMVRDIAQLFVAGPPVVRHAMGYDITKEDLGGWQVHCTNGSVDNLAESEEEAIALVARTKVFKLAESLGGVESLIEHPARMTHASTAESSFAAPPHLVRPPPEQQQRGQHPDRVDGEDDRLHDRGEPELALHRDQLEAQLLAHLGVDEAGHLDGRGSLPSLRHPGHRHLAQVVLRQHDLAGFLRALD